VQFKNVILLSIWQNHILTFKIAILAFKNVRFLKMHHHAGDLKNADFFFMFSNRNFLKT